VRHFAIFLLAAWATLVAFGPASAQQFNDPLRASDRSGAGLVSQFDSTAGVDAEAATLDAQVAAATADRPALLVLKVKIAHGKHTYSLTQPAGGPLPSKIELEPSRDYRLLGEFRAYPAAHSRVEQGPVWTGLEIQEHEGEFIWFAPIEITAGVDPGELTIQGTLNMSVCQTGGYCEPVEKEISARLAADANVPAEIEDAIAQAASSSHGAAGTQQPDGQAETQWSSGSIQLDSSAVKFSGEVVPSTVQPGAAAALKFTAALPKGSRIYAHSDRDHQKGTKPVLIAIERASGLLPHRATTDAPIKIDNSVPQFGVMKYHEGEVTWTVPIEIPANAPPGDYSVAGLIGYQACEYSADGKNVCELPQAIQFEAALNVGPTKGNSSAPIRFAKGGNYAEVARAASAFAASLDATSSDAPPSTPGTQPLEPPKNEPPALTAADSYDLSRIQINKSTNSIGHYIALAFVGGLLLNLMPCVLPVIGLKVMTFVEQAGKSRAHAFVLNLWFAVGIIAVFLVLALLASLPKLGLGAEGLVWGGQNGSTVFNVVIASIVFAMALSLLGVWEVPIPGFFGSRSLQKASAQEGPLGAILKGVVTTVLATPCTAPFMAAAVAWAVSQSVGTTLVVFTSLGLGMASPYVLIGVYPELLKFLPKPGAWMETFKQISGFVLLATVVFILSYIEPTAIVPTILLLLGIAVACWLVARTPLTAELRDRALAWSYAGAIVLLFLAVSFGWLYRVANAAADPGWQPFSLARLKQVAVDEGRTVLVDFSAEWCINCKVFERTVLHTKPVEQAIDRENVVTMYADFTDYPEEIGKTIRALGANGVPVIAIFPGNAPYEPIVFGGGYTKDGIITALQDATSRRTQSTRPSVAEASAGPPSVN
jgi:thiol:disulfide interchange protein/DsbC/DsbD-like thiol-disulfide interchange protein